MELTWLTAWYEIKRWLEHQLNMSGDMLHMQFGMAVFITCAILLRNRRNGLLLGWCILALIQTINEVLDARDWITWTGSVNWSETAKDFAATLFWPSVLLLSWRWIGCRDRAKPDSEDLG